MTGKELGQQPAFPEALDDWEQGVRISVHVHGATLRQEFSKAALQGMLADPTIQPQNGLPEDQARQILAQGLAQSAVRYADALLDELAKVQA